MPPPGSIARRVSNLLLTSLYTDDDLLRLQQILISRELGLPLEAIRRSLDDPAFDHRRALVHQREQLLQRVEQTTAMIAAIDAALDAVEGGAMEKIFEGFDHAKYEAEAQERWGRTDAYKEAARRTKGYRKADWERHRSEQESIYRDAAALVQRGVQPSSEEALGIAERHRQLIDRWFYPCSPEMHAGLASLYEGDSRFADGMNAHAAGLAAFLVAAIRANRERAHG